MKSLMMVVVLSGVASAQQVGPVRKAASRIETTVSLGVGAQATISQLFRSD